MTWYEWVTIVALALFFVWLGVTLYFYGKFDQQVMLVKALQDAGEHDAARKVVEDMER